MDWRHRFKRMWYWLWNLLKRMEIRLTRIVKREVKRNLIGFLTFIVIILNLFAFWYQNDLAQTLNQPLCAVKQVKVEPVRDNVIQISAIIKNFGKYVAEDSSIDWTIEKIIDWERVKTNNGYVLHFKAKQKIDEGQYAPITLLPEHEIDAYLYFIQTGSFNEMVQGFKGAVMISLRVNYKNMNKERKQFSCVYLVTRLPDIKENLYERLLIESKLQSF